MICRYLGVVAAASLCACAGSSPSAPAAPTASALPVALPPPLPPASPREVAEAAWQNRDQRPALEQALAAWAELAAEEAADPAVLVRLARGHLYLAEWFVAAEGDLQKTRTVLERGLAASERALFALAPAFAARVQAGEAPETAIDAVLAPAIEPLILYGANLWRYVAADLRTATLYRSRVEAALRRALALDPTFDGAAAHRWLGIVKARLPVAAGGDLNEAKRHFDDALRLAPERLENRVLFAEHYAREARDRTLWRALLNGVAEIPDETVARLAAEDRQAHQRARLLLNHVDEVF